MFEQEAKEYRNHNTNYYEWDAFCADDGEAIEEAYQKGAEFGAGRLKWHDLRKNPDDLPTDKHFKITSDGDIALYDLFLGKRYDLRSDELTYQLAAWCEIPTFEV